VDAREEDSPLEQERERWDEQEQERLHEERQPAIDPWT
jgi:hypothetical protein